MDGTINQPTRRPDVLGKKYLDRLYRDVAKPAIRASRSSNPVQYALVSLAPCSTSHIRARRSGCFQHRILSFPNEDAARVKHTLPNPGKRIGRAAIGGRDPLILVAYDDFFLDVERTKQTPGSVLSTRKTW